MKIILIDDEIVALNALKKRVDWEKYGFTDVYTAQDAASAKEILGKESIDLMLCDIEMPGESGLALVEYAKKYYPLTHAIMVTCHADFTYVKRAMKCGVLDYILKPIDYEELETMLQQFSVERRKELMYHKGPKEEENDQTKERLERIKQYIDEHIHEKIKVEDLAKVVHLNEQHMMRVFKRETGQSIVEYITERRIKVASSLLKDTDYSINYISDRIGCENYSYFTKVFKKATGFTPREYRSQFKKS